MPLPENNFSLYVWLTKTLSRRYGCLMLLLLAAPIVLLIGYLFRLLSLELVTYIPDSIHGMIMLLGVILLLFSYFRKAVVKIAGDGSVHISSPLWSDVAKGLGMIFLFFEMMVLFANVIGDDWIANIYGSTIVFLFLLTIAVAVWKLRTDTDDKIVIGDNEVVVDLPLKRSQLKLERNQIIEIRTHHRWTKFGKDKYITFKYAVSRGPESAAAEHTLEPSDHLNVRRSIIVKVLQAKGYTVTEA